MAESDAQETPSSFPADFTAGPFVTRHEPVQDLIHTVSNLYLETHAAEGSDNDEEKLPDQREENLPPTDTDGELLPSPSPLEEDQQSLFSMVLATQLFHHKRVMQVLEEHFGQRADCLEEQVHEL